MLCDGCQGKCNFISICNSCEDNIKKRKNICKNTGKTPGQLLMYEYFQFFSKKKRKKLLVKKIEFLF